MSEYIHIESEPTGDADVVRLVTNLTLVTGGEPEVYASVEEGEEGSPLAQALFAVPGLAALRVEGSDLLVRRAPGVEWHNLIEDISDALREFFL